MNQVLLSSVKMDWRTPQPFFDILNSEFNFNLDPCCDEKNAKCHNHYTQEDNGLQQDWTGSTVFVNPPYGREIGKWVKKCYEESLKPNTRVVMLIPSRTDTSYFHDYILGKSEIRFLRGRIKFWDDDNNPKDPAPFPSMVVIY